jgi:hypothetical protein
MMRKLVFVLFSLLIFIPNAWAEKAPTKPSDAKQAKIESKVLLRKDVSDKHQVRVTIQATSKVPLEMLDHLSRSLEIRRLAPNELSRPDLGFWRDKTRALDSAHPEVTVLLQPTESGLKASEFIWIWPDGFVPIHPGILQVKQEYLMGKKLQAHIPSLPKLTLKGPVTRLKGQIKCRVPDKVGSVEQNFSYAQITIGQYRAFTDASGRFEMEGQFPATGSLGSLHVTYDSQVTAPPSLSTRLVVMDDVHNPRSDSAPLPAGTVSGTTRDLGNIIVETGDCALWVLGVYVLEDFHTKVRNSPPAGKLRIKRWSGVYNGIPYSFYDYIVLSTDYIKDNRNKDSRESTIAHEFGHTIRHAADGDLTHWNWDNFRWAYARVHSGKEITNVQLAFNEGWAGYWKWVVKGTLPSLSGVPGVEYMDWNEIRVTNRLAELGGSAGPAQMVRVLTSNPKSIHSLYEFEQKYCKLVSLPNTYCTADHKPKRAHPPSCPPKYIDDGATCRLDNIKAKPSHTRGAGVVPKDCGEGRDYDTGLCYPKCRDGYKGAGPVCWQSCAPGFRDDGAFCAKPQPYGRGVGYPWKVGDKPFSLDDARRRCNKDHSQGCEKHGAIIYPKCKEGFHAAGCCICSPDCPRDQKDIGVSCAKKSYGRDAGKPPTKCSGTQEYDTGLCYNHCKEGYKGVGPVCWGKCPEGFDDHGATCYKAPHIIVKY